MKPGGEDIWYAGGGEAYGSSTSALSGDIYLGYGLLKSNDNGSSWRRIPFEVVKDIHDNTIPAGFLEVLDHPFDNVHRIVVHPQSGHIYIAAYNAVLRSVDEGNSFHVVFQGGQSPSQRAGQTEVALAGNKVLIAINGSHPEVETRGVWISETGDKQSWRRIAGGVTPGVDFVAGWRGNITGSTDVFATYGKRILLAVAPTRPDICYVLYQNGVLGNAPEADLFSATIADNAVTWANRSSYLPWSSESTANHYFSNPVRV